MKPAAVALLLLAAPAAAETLFVSDEAGRCVQVIDGATLERNGCIEVGPRPRGLAVSSDGKRLYVAVSDADRIVVVDIATRKVARTLDSGPDPETLALSPDERMLYVANEDDNLLSIIPIDGGQPREVLVGGEPEGTAVSPDGRTVLQASEMAAMVHVIDTASATVRGSVIVDTRPRFVAFTPDGSRFWVSSEARGTVALFDGATLEPLGKIDFTDIAPTAEPVQPVGIRFTRDGKRAFVALGRGRLVAEVDPGTLKIVRSWPVGWRAWNLALAPDERRLYTADGLDGTVSVIDLATGQTLPPIRLGGKPWGIEAVP